MFRSIVLLVGGLASLVAVSSPAQEAILGQKYGYGVHDYFSGDYLKAYEQLTAAIDGGSKDPRVFYFRGLVYQKLGRAQESVQDFQKGAELESKDVNKFYNVSKALERVQGPARAELENYRVEARMAALEEAERLHKSRYEAIQREEARVLREQPPAPPESVKTPEPSAEKSAEPVATPAAEPAAADPFAAPEEKPAPKAAKKPAKKAVAEPVAEESGEKAAETSAAAGGDDPFAAPATKPARKAAAKAVEEEKEPAAKTEAADPFATEPAADEKPVKKAGKASGKKAVKAAKEEKPAADEKSEEKGNPFLDESSSDEKKSGAKEEPAADEKEPAAEEKPAAEKKPTKGKKAAEKKSAAKKKVEKKADSDDPFAQ